jgi:hypothetical protein
MPQVHRPSRIGRTQPAAAASSGSGSRFGEAVEPLYCRLNTSTGRPAFAGQLLERVGLDDDVGLQPLVGNALSRWQSREYVAVAVMLVEYQPRQDARAGYRRDQAANQYDELPRASTNQHSGENPDTEWC